jgi:hypothetical protein
MAVASSVDRMRTRFEIEETTEYVGTRDLLVRRAAAWAEANGHAFDPMAAQALLDSRHFSPDGRLGYWTPNEVRRALLRWLPTQMTVPSDATLRTLLRYLDARGLRDPRGATLAENEKAIDEAANETPVPYRGGPPLEERALPQLPVWLPAPEELEAAAGQSKVVSQLREFVRWLEPDGRALTEAGNIKPADARELIRRLGTGEENLRFRSATELNGLNLIVTWAKKSRLVRKQGNMLVPVAKSQTLLDDAEALWQRAFDAAFDLGEAAILPRFTNEPQTPVSQLYNDIAPDLLNTIYSMPEPLPVSRMAVLVRDNIEELFALDKLDESRLTVFRTLVDRDVNQILNVFEHLGAVISTQGMASEVFTSDLDEDGPFNRRQARALRERLKEPDRLVALTPLGTRAMRQRLLAEGRDVPLVGELADASAAAMLGVVSQHYPEQASADEIARWRAAHGRSLEPLLAAVRECPFVVRQVAFLLTLAADAPEGEGLLTDLLTDPELGAVALVALRGEASPEETDEGEAPLLMTGTVLQFLEMGGPEQVRASLSQMPRASRNDLIQTVLGSGFPAPETMAEFRTLVADPLLHNHRVADHRPDRTIRHQHRRQPKRRGHK